jgi:hypothetical protein
MKLRRYIQRPNNETKKHKSKATTRCKEGKAYEDTSVISWRAMGEIVGCM